MKLPLRTSNRWPLPVGPLLVKTARSFLNDGCLNMSAAIAFYAILSLIPLAFFLVWGAGFFFEHSENARQILLEAIRNLMPEFGEEFQREMAAVERKKALIGGIGLGFLLWSATLVFSALEFAFNKIFRVDERRSFMRSRIISLGMIVIGVVILIGSIVLTTIAQTAKSYPIVIFDFDLTRFFLGSIFFQYILPFFLLTVIFTVIYIILPRVSVGLIEGFTGGLLCAALFEGAKHLFTWYVKNLGRHSLIYGSLGAIVAVIIWFFYVASIILFCGEFIALWNRDEPAQDKI